MHLAYKTKIDPGMCPICGNPICTNVPITCSEACVHSKKNSCYQLGNSDDHRVCECSRTELLSEIFGRISQASENQKGYQLAELLITRLQNIYIPLPDELFEI